MHLTTHGDLLFTDNRDVVLGLTGNETGVAANAVVEVDGHRPLLALVKEVLVSLRFVMPSLTALLACREKYSQERGSPCPAFSHLPICAAKSLCAVAIVSMVEISRAKRTVIHRVVLLSHGDGVTLIGVFGLAAGGEVRGLAVRSA